jgi:hypothetical protein
MGGPKNRLGSCQKWACHYRNSARTTDGESRVQQSAAAVLCVGIARVTHLEAYRCRGVPFLPRHAVR